MTFPNELIPVLGPVLAALIAASAAFLASVLSKESKTSEFRQAWIDHLRDDLADFVAAYALLTDMAQSVNDDDGFNEWVKLVKSEMLQVESAKARIVLRLNPDEHDRLISKISALTSHEAIYGDEHDRDRMLDTLVSESQLVLKLEWRRVKRGERAYQLTKWASLGVVAFLMVAALILVVLHLT